MGFFMTPADQRIVDAVTVEGSVDDDTGRRFYKLYSETFGDLVTKAVARQLLREDEFMEEMSDERVDKFLAWDENGEAVAMCTLTRHLETVPWIEPAYFAHHFPEHTARDAVYYLGFILVSHRHRGGHLFFELVRRVTETVAARRGLCAYDICSYNNEVLGLAEATAALLQGLGRFDVQVMDTQSYYRAITLAPQTLPEMRPRSL
jgi:hypothetical protein